jgi:chromate transporter
VHHGVTFGDAFRVWLRVAANSFGGPAGQIAVMHRILVDEKRWVGEDRFLHALNYCMLLPGPEAQQLATYIGWLLHGTVGGLVAGALFVLPGFLSILALSILYVSYADVSWVAALLFGLKAAVLAVVVEAVLRIGRRVLHNPLMIGVAVAAFAGMWLLRLPFPLVVVTAGVAGFVGSRTRPDLFVVIKVKQGPAAKLDAALDGIALRRPDLRRSIATAAGWLVLWLGPVAALAATRGKDDVFTQVGTFFSGAAVVTFGGAYSVLAYIAQRAVEHHGWLTGPEMLDGLGMAETTPGPLIQVVQFVGFLATYRHPGHLSPMVAGTLGAVLTTWVTFVPSFLWIFTGAPYIEWLRGNVRLSGALSTITAAVVGVVLNLAVWFALQVVFTEVRDVRPLQFVHLVVPVWSTFDPAAAAISTIAAVALLRFHAPLLATLAGCALLGWISRATW